MVEKFYNRNIFSFKGRINRLHYFLYLFALNIIAKIGTVAFLMSDSSSGAAAGMFIVGVPIAILHLFNIKKRGQDIWENEATSWCIAAYLVFAPFVLSAIIYEIISIDDNTTAIVTVLTLALSILVLNIPLLFRAGKTLPVEKAE